MSELKVMIDQNMLTVPFDSAELSVSLKDLLDNHGVAVPSECGGVGKCGFCLVHIKSGACSPLTLAEQSTLTESEIRKGYRLACQTRPLGDINLSIAVQTE